MVREDVQDESARRRVAVLAYHHWFNGEMSRLELSAWTAARSLSSRETITMVQALLGLRDTLRRHCKFAAVLVYPFIGEARAQRFVREHLEHQPVVQAAATRACDEAHGALAEDLASFARRLASFFQAERDLIVTSTVQHTTLVELESSRQI